MQELKYKPRGFWIADDASPLKEYSGYASEGTVSVDSYGLPVTPTATASHLFDNSKVGIFDNKVMTRQDTSFSLSVVFCPVDQDGLSYSDQQILGTQNNMDGLTINGTILSFTTKYTGQPASTLTYDIEVLRKVHAVGVHTPTKNSLFIDGVIVAEIDISVDQQAAAMLTSATLRSGNSTSGRGLLVNNIAQYNYAISKEAVLDIYTYQNRRAEGSISKSFGGKDIFFNRAERPHYLTHKWEVQGDYSQGVHDGTTLDGDTVSAQLDENGLTISGQYYDSTNLLEGLMAEPIDSVNMDWSGENITIETSVDEVNWYEAVKGKNLLSVPHGFDPNLQPTLFIRVVFDPEKEYAYLAGMRVDGYLEGTLVPLNDRTRTFVNAVNLNEHIPAEFSDDWGVHVTSGSVAVGADTSGSPEPFRTIEFWVKSVLPVTISPSISTGTSATYTNGAAGTVNKPGQWTVYHYVYPAGINPTFTFSGSEFSLGKVSLFTDALTAGQIATLVRNYTGINTIAAGTAGALSMAEGTPTYSIYAHDWASISGI